MKHIFLLFRQKEETSTGTNYERIGFIRLPFKHYVSCQLPRTTRRTMALFRSGALPLAVETGRYSRPQIPLNERLCKFCNTNSVENEIHLLMLCPLYSDIRYELFQKALEFINNFNMMNVENKFIELMNYDKIQIMLAHTLH
jgi:hypothetical protein